MPAHQLYRLQPAGAVRRITHLLASAFSVLGSPLAALRSLGLILLLRLGDFRRIPRLDRSDSPPRSPAKNWSRLQRAGKDSRIPESRTGAYVPSFELPNFTPRSPPKIWSRLQRAGLDSYALESRTTEIVPLFNPLEGLMLLINRESREAEFPEFWTPVQLIRPPPSGRPEAARAPPKQASQERPGVFPARGAARRGCRWQLLPRSAGLGRRERGAGGIKSAAWRRL